MTSRVSMTATMLFHWPRRAAIGSTLCAALLWAAAEVLPAHAQGGGQPAAGVPEDDPFADELNPFGRGAGTPPSVPTQPDSRPAMPSRGTQRLPVPFPIGSVAIKCCS